MRNLILAILCCFSLSCFAQKHMKFAGIPIDGNVYSFCEQLKKHGYKHNPEEAESTLSFVGKFYGEDAYVDVTYDPSNKVVYQVNVSIIKKFAFELTTIQRDIMKAIEDKYVNKKELKDEQLYQYDYYIFDGYDPIGMIQTFILDTSQMKPGGESMLSISYLDVENYMKYEEKKRQDI
ncbi:MAG: hypothetical protein MJZ37_09365 [Bacilli bacterium]|nr:hypothetical protein [Bacilli bacterium]